MFDAYLQDPLKAVAVLTLRVMLAFRWLILSVFYLALFFRFQMVAFVILIIPLMALAIAYQKDVEREKIGMDDFSADRLFFRYGELLSTGVIAIPVAGDWSHAKTESYAETLRENLARRVQGRVPEKQVHVSPSIDVTDTSTGERKRFLRIVVRSSFGSTITKFLHFAPFGQTITAHIFTYGRGAHSDWETVKFFIESPITIWRWGLPWLLNRFSIMARVTKVRRSSFDAIDLNTMYSLARDVCFSELEELLEAEGLLSENVRQAINVFMTNNQTFNSSGSSTVNVGVTQSSVQTPKIARA